MAAPVRVGLDVRMAGASGIGTYISALLAHLPDEPAVALVPLSPAAPPYSIREQWPTPALHRGLDVLHAPHYNAPLAATRPLVVTLHDVAHLALPHVFAAPAMRLYAHAMLRAAVTRAARVIAVSAFTRDELVRRLDADPARIRVIHQGVDERYRPPDDHGSLDAALARVGVARPFVLYVGNVKQHKNIGGLLRAFEGLAELPQRLVVAGALGTFRVGDARVERRLARGRARGRVIATGHVDDDTLLALYRGADALAMPSLYEGFGLPVVEAMACGTPVVCSDRASLPEVAGDAALLVDPTDPATFAAALRRALTDRALRDELTARGLERAARFCWSRTAAAHAEVYTEVASG